MATYAELLTASINTTLRDKTIVAVVIAAEAIRTEADTVANHAARAAWAKTAYASPEQAARSILWSMLAQTQVSSPSATIAAITGATDAVVQAAVNNAVNAVA